jgi:hypothetical protein
LFDGTAEVWGIVMRRRMILMLLLGMVLSVVLAGSGAKADRQCWEPYLFLNGSKITKRVCLPCVGDLCWWGVAGDSSGSGPR